MNKLGYMALLSAVLTGGATAQKSTAPRNTDPWSYDSSSNTVSAPAGSRVAVGTPCPAGAPNGSVCMNGQAIAPVAVSALPAASAGEQYCQLHKHQWNEPDAVYQYGDGVDTIRGQRRRVGGRGKRRPFAAESGSGV